MPAKIDDSSNLRFLYLCFVNSNYSSIDFAAVARASDIKPPAARMRFARLKAGIDPESVTASYRSGTYSGAEGRKRKADIEKHKGTRKNSLKAGHGQGGMVEAADQDDEEGVIVKRRVSSVSEPLAKRLRSDAKPALPLACDVRPEPADWQQEVKAEDVDRKFPVEHPLRATSVSRRWSLPRLVPEDRGSSCAYPSVGQDLKLFR